MDLFSPELWQYVYFNYIFPLFWPYPVEEVHSTEWRRYMTLCILFILGVGLLWKGSHGNLPPGPWGFPIIGNLTQIQRDPHIKLTLLKERFGDMYTLQLGRYHAVVICSLDGIQEGLVRLASKCSGRSPVLSTHQLYKGIPEQGVCCSDPDVVYEAKKDFVQLGLDHLCSSSEGLEDIIANESLDLLTVLLQSDRACDPSLVVESMYLRIMLYIVNGKLYEREDENFLGIWKTYRLRAEACAENWLDFIPFLKKFQKHKWMTTWERSALHFKYQRKIINRHKDCYNPSLIHDLIDQMLLHLEQDGDMGVLDQEDLDQLFVELSGSGFLAVTQTLLWIILYVSAFPDVQKKVQEELASVVGKDRLPKMSDQPYLPYTCAVVMETQRLASVLPFLYPHRTTENVTLSGYDLPKDTLLYFNVWSLHHDQRYWRNPMKFNPARFLQPDGTLHIPDYFLPYGDGLRSCPGQSLADIQLFLVFTTLVHQMSFSLDPEQPVSLTGVYQGSVLSPKPFKVTATSRILLV